MNEDTESETAIKFGSGVQFNFAEGVFIKTTRVNNATDKTADSTDDNFHSTPKPILRGSPDIKFITPEITTDSRIRTLEVGINQILRYM